MKRLKFLSALFVVVLIVLMAVPAFAQKRDSLRTSQPRESEGIFNDEDGNAMDSGVWVYGITLFADEANSVMGVYDVDTDAELFATTTYSKDEVGEATANDSVDKWYPTPKYFEDGVGAIIKTGVGLIHYGPAPTD